MTDNKYCFLLVKSEKYNINEIFFLHIGDNTIGKDIDCDIVIQLEDEPIDLIHAKIIVDANYSDLGIEDLSIFNSIIKENKGNSSILKKRREYEFNSERVYYLTSNVKLMKIEGNLEELILFLNKYNLTCYYNELKLKYKEFINSKCTKNKDNIINEYENLFQNKKREDFNNLDYYSDI